MRTPFPLILTLLIGLSLAACTRGTRSTPTSGTVPPILVPTHPSLTGPITADGFLRHPEFTSYQYGTYALLDATGHTLYALRATTLDLDPYAEHSVHLTGTPVPGYPLAGGPPLLDVTAIRATSP